MPCTFNTDSKNTKWQMKPSLSGSCSDNQDSPKTDGKTLDNNAHLKRLLLSVPVHLSRFLYWEKPLMMPVHFPQGQGLKSVMPCQQL